MNARGCCRLIRVGAFDEDRPFDVLVGIGGFAEDLREPGVGLEIDRGLATTGVGFAPGTPEGLRQDLMQDLRKIPHSFEGFSTGWS